MWTQRRSGLSHHRPFDHRDPYERDLTRIIHSPAFRRLQRKTQIHGTDTGDFHRTRLTHSLEVASIARSIVRNLNATSHDAIIKNCLPSDDLISSISLLHDIGHPPFGHGGETALNFAMHAHGGFEGNAQTLHLVTKTETSYGAYGLDLTRRTLLGILKYPAPLEKLVLTSVAKPDLIRARPRGECSSNLHSTPPDGRGSDVPCHSDKKIINAEKLNDWIPPKGYYAEDEPEVEWILSPFTSGDRVLFQNIAPIPSTSQFSKTVYRSLDCSIMDLADDIAYGIHDLEDAIHLQLITREMLDTQAFKDILHNTTLDAHLLDQLFSKESRQTKNAIGDLVHYCITNTHPVQTNLHFENHVLQYNVIFAKEAQALISHLKQFIHVHVIDSKKARKAEHDGQTIILRLFEALRQQPETLLDIAHQHRYKQAQNEHEALRVLCDYIANMSDEQAVRDCRELKQ